MKHWAILACAALGASLGSASTVRAEGEAPAAAPAGKRIVVDIRSNRIILMDIARPDGTFVAVGERGFTLQSADGKDWRGVATPVTRTLTGIAFRDEKVGVAVGHGGSFVRTEDGGTTWTQVTVDEAGTDSLLGVTHLGGDRFLAYGAFGMLFDSQDAGRTWQRVMVESEDFDRHISEVVRMSPTALLMVAESGTLVRSDDNGVTWTSLVSPYQGSFFGAIALQDGSVLAYGMRGNVFRSADQGATWQKVDLGTTISVNGGRQLSDGRVLLVGNGGLLALSEDAGQSFKVVKSPIGKGFASLVESGGQVMLAGEGGVTPFDPAWFSAK
jgi:photosystem II stability/assembly factor-like uncharacterized protein